MIPDDLQPGLQTRDNLQIYSLLCHTGGDACSPCNALLWQPVSFEPALDRQLGKSRKQKVEMHRGRLLDELRSRTKRFAAEIIQLYVKLPKPREEVRVLGKQLLRSGTSVAAQIREASRARSNDEFASKLGGALQEADESQLWLELLREECGVEPALTTPLEAEASELMAIFTTMIKRTKGES